MTVMLTIVPYDRFHDAEGRVWIRTGNGWQRFLDDATWRVAVSRLEHIGPDPQPAHTGPKARRET